ncbi:TPA: restriction endonuclease subunit S [Klebsiella aerogenes]|nr:restriction endonuclease subunit S [Klebsiella aerogenes]HCR0217277.1 restriction endonuclease subunit S [Klebsiella aerogenes]HCR0959394.1 restriction endonuclease subunit S [Klebsiella aerogenes]HCT6900470.1 restriction endonuclease subunit S [Klebsiella aerogenes]HEM8232888.1 restriction endonuclease subunit S [Klebsiella aerogenes]
MAKYKAYPEYKDSGVEWLGAIPEDWSVTKLKYIADLLTAKSTNSDDLFVGLENISSGDGKYISKEENIADGASVSFEKNDVLFGKLRPYLAKSWLATFSGVCSSEFLVLRTAKLHPKYLNYFSLTNEFIDQVNSSTYGSKMPRASWEFIGLLPVPTCSYSLSEKVAGFLDYETAKIDNLIEKQQQLIELLKEKRQAVVSHAVTKGLNPDVPMKDSGVEWLGEVPTHWGIPKLLHVTKAIGDGLHSTPKYDIATGYYFINGNNLVDGKISIGSTAKEVSRDEYNKHYVCLDKKTVLLSINGTIGNVAIYNNEKVILGKSAAYINCGSELDVNYLMYYFITNESRYYFDLEVTGTTIFNLSLNSIRQMKVCIPPLEEQRLIVECCVEKQKQYNYLIDSAEMAIRVMQERRTALISAAVTGKIDVRDWVAPDTQGVEEPQEATA